MTRFLHVANGTSTTATIHAAGLPGRSSIWADVLHDGPVPGGLSDDALLEVRSRHLAGSAGVSPDNTTTELTRWRAAIAAGDPFDELVLWYEHDLFDQLNLIQLLSWLAALPGGARARRSSPSTRLLARPLQGPRRADASGAGVAASARANPSARRSSRSRNRRGRRSARPTRGRLSSCSTAIPRRCRFSRRRCGAISRSSRGPATGFRAPSGGCWSCSRRALPASVRSFHACTTSRPPSISQTFRFSRPRWSLLWRLPA